MKSDNSEIIIYQTEDGLAKIYVRTDGETVWLTQAQMAELFQTTKQNISLHISNIFKDGELEPLATVKEYLTVQNEGKIDEKSNVQNLHIPISRLLRIRRKNWKTKTNVKIKGAMWYEIGRH